MSSNLEVEFPLSLSYFFEGTPGGSLQATLDEHTARNGWDCRLIVPCVLGLTLLMGCGGARVSPALEPPTVFVISTQPKDATISEGAQSTFSVEVTGGLKPYTYQWFRNNIAIPIEGGGSKLTTLPTTPYDDAAMFKVRITDSANLALSSEEVVLHVQPAFTSSFSEDGRTFLAADHPGFSYWGRIDATIPAQPVMIWEGSSVRARFHGTSLGLRFAQAQVGRRNTTFNVIIDGESRLLSIDASKPPYSYLWLGALADTEHELTLFKRSEASDSTIAFQGVYLDKAQTTLGTAPDPASRRIEIYGDSIAAGAFSEYFPYDNDIGGTASAAALSTSTNYTAYGAIAARDLQADYSCIAVSGIGLAYSDALAPTMLQVWDRIYYLSTDTEMARAANAYPFNSPAPDIVVINLGENDSRYKGAATFQADFVAAYRALVANLRGKYPGAAIVMTLGGMSASVDPIMNAAFDTAVASLSSDKSVYSLKFAHWTPHHPRDFDHRILANELTTFLRSKHLAN